MATSRLRIIAEWLGFVGEWLGFVGLMWFILAGMILACVLYPLILCAQYLLRSLFRVARIPCRPAPQKL